MSPEAAVRAQGQVPERTAYH